MVKRKQNNPDNPVNPVQINEGSYKVSVSIQEPATSIHLLTEGQPKINNIQ